MECFVNIIKTSQKGQVILEISKVCDKGFFPSVSVQMDREIALYLSGLVRSDQMKARDDVS